MTNKGYLKYIQNQLDALICRSYMIPMNKKKKRQFDKLIKNVCLYLSELSPDYIENEIKKAYLFARDAHHGVMRLSGDPYINHPVEATQILLDLKEYLRNNYWTDPNYQNEIQ